MNEWISIRLKLILSHVLIVMIPVIVIISILFVQSRNAITTEVSNANMALADQVTNLMNLKFKDVDSTSIVLIADQDVLEVISKTQDDYDNLYYMLKDREDNLFSLITSLKSSERELRNVAFVTDNEVIDPDRTDAYFEENFINEFFDSEQYTITQEAKARPRWFYGLYGTDHIYFSDRYAISIPLRRGLC